MTRAGQDPAFLFGEIKSININLTKGFLKILGIMEGKRRNGGEFIKISFFKYITCLINGWEILGLKTANEGADILFTEQNGIK
jgi:hypothetical protein